MDAQPTSPASVRSAPPTRRDRDALRTLAHPLRSRLLGELRVNGAATATDLARALGTNSGATSYHLRQLAEVGLIEQVTGGRGRQRPWQAAPDLGPAEGWGGDLDDEDDAAAADWLARDYLQHFTERAGGWLDHRGQWLPAWQETCGLEDHLVQVTAEQLTALRAELLEVLERYRRLGQGNPRAKRVSVYTCALPVDRRAGPP